MQNLHLFDKNRYFEDMMANQKPELRDLYKKRYLLNSYRTAHGEPIYEGKQSGVSKIFNNLFKNFSTKKAPLALGPHFERDYPILTHTSTPQDSIDKNLVKALAAFYGNVVTGDTTEFESYLQEYFKTNYSEITGNNYQEFLSNFSKEDGELYKIAKFFRIDTGVFGNNFGTDLIVKDGLVYENSKNGLNVIYANDKSICNTISDLYGVSLYHKHLVDYHATLSKEAAKLQNEFIEYASQNGISPENLPEVIRKNMTPHEQNNVIDFKQSV